MTEQQQREIAEQILRDQLGKSWDEATVEQRRAAMIEASFTQRWLD